MPEINFATVQISRSELKAWIDEKGDYVLIDTSLEEVFQAAHLPTAQNACVFEVTFLDQVKALRGIEADPRTQRRPIVLYGNSAHSLASVTAAEKLEAAGFGNLHVYGGGLAEWREANFPLEGSGHFPKTFSSIEDRDYQVDRAESRLEWTGRSLTSTHRGTITIASGWITVQNHHLTGGEFVADMTSIANTDLEDSSLRSALLHHLESDDFFDVARFPEARFVLQSMEPIPGATPGAPNYQIRGQLRLKDVLRGLDFLAVIDRADDGALVGRADFDIDRTLWNVRYGSGKFYEKLGMHLVCDFISLDLKIVAR